MEKLVDFEWPEAVKTAIRENSQDHGVFRKILVSVVFFSFYEMKP